LAIRIVRNGWLDRSASSEPSLHPSRLCYRYCLVMLIESRMN
jgi:hypothetical protein